MCSNKNVRIYLSLPLVGIFHSKYKCLQEIFYNIS